MAKKRTVNLSLVQFCALVQLHLSHGNNSVWSALHPRTRSSLVNLELVDFAYPLDSGMGVFVTQRGVEKLRVYAEVAVEWGASAKW